ncbi:hypothetical protein [Kitasatospora brasiliensis]|uniref:hypothetical protein n=1 Tax=Kitasatospora brasiliensis TaxID=3058040 RepID=UPI00292DDE6A|nr:hypothetical protein [Kitasatospora sp. K002]
MTDNPATTRRRPNASTINDLELDLLWQRAEDAEARLQAVAADLITAGHTVFADRLDIVRRLCAGELTPREAHDEDRGE